MNVDRHSRRTRQHHSLHPGFYMHTVAVSGECAPATAVIVITYSQHKSFVAPTAEELGAEGEKGTSGHV